MPFRIKNLKILILLFGISFICNTPVKAQLSLDSTTQFVIGASGFDTLLGNFNISFTIGEVIIPTVSATGPQLYFLTQGFNQPIENENLELNSVVKNETCIGASNGFITVSVTNSGGPFTYSWQPNTIDTSATAINLSSGIYYVTVTDIVNGNSATDTVIVASESIEVCGLIIYSGLTPNEDGKNDTWVIDRILDFPSNKVFIFNRWGEEVWRGVDYNNTTVLWTGQSKSGQELPDGTYFYYIKTDPKEYKGWVELTR